MRAVIFHGPGDVRVEDAPKPGQPGPGQVLLRVLYASICGTDLGEYLHGPTRVPLHQRHPVSGHVGPVILGHEFVGEIVAVGPGVQRFSVGERVVPGAGNWCGTCRWCADGRPNLCANYFVYGLQADGGLAEFARVPARMCHRVPDGCDDEAAAVAQPLAIALHGLRRSQLRQGDALAVIGVGGIGSFLLAGARARGAAPLVAVDIDQERLRTAASFGATHTIHAAGDVDTVAARIWSLTGGGPDIVVEASGKPDGLAVALASARRGGTVLLVGLQDQHPMATYATRTCRRPSLYWPQPTSARSCDIDSRSALTRLQRVWRAWLLDGCTARSSSRSARWWQYPTGRHDQACIDWPRGHSRPRWRADFPGVRSALLKRRFARVACCSAVQALVGGDDTG